MECIRASAPWRERILLTRRVTTRFALLALLAAPGCRDAGTPLGIQPGRALLTASETDADLTTRAVGAPATYTNGASASASSSRLAGGLAPLFSVTGAADPRNVVRIYKNHDAWRTNPDGGRDEASLQSMGKTRNTDYFVHPMTELESGIPAGTRVVVITANSLGDATTSAAQRSALAQEALAAFLATGGTLLLDLADNEAGDGYRTPGATGTPLLSLPSDCRDATFAPAALGADGASGTSDDHRFVRGPDGVAATADDLDDVRIDLSRGGSDQQDDQNTDPAEVMSACSVVHGSLDQGMSLPSNARVLATATWGPEQRPVLAEYCHAGGRVVVNTFTLGYFGHKPREGTSVPLRMSYIQKSLYAYALSAETYCNKAPSIMAPADVDVVTDGGMCTATIADLGAAEASDDAEGVAVAGSRADGQPLNAPYPNGVTTITWTATDADGESATATQVVSVKDLEPPVLVAPANKTAEIYSAGATARVDAGAAAASDNCSDAPVAITAARSDGAGALDDPYGVGVTTITWSAKDEAGNETSAQQTITVALVDREAPVLTLPGAMVVNATVPGGAKVKYIATASDNFGPPSLSCVPKSGTLFAIGVKTVSCTAADAAGNSAAGSFTVRVLGAPEQIVNLIEYVKGAMIPSPNRTYLIDYLTRVLADPRSTSLACRYFDLFIAAVNARKGTSISAAKAKVMIADATRIKAVLGCPTVP